ncbi:MAG: hypothetical protein AAB922_04745 [Patescibacteria group bacterium]
MKKCKSCLHEKLVLVQYPCNLCDKTSSQWQDNGKGLLLQQLEIVIDHCNETGLKAGAGAVREAIKLIKEAGDE